MSLSEFRYARLITWKEGAIGRILSTSSSQRELIHAHGQIGSNQKSTGVRSAESVICVLLCATSLTVGSNLHAPFVVPPDGCKDASMPGTNLTRDEARTRASLIDVDSYTEELYLTTDDTTLRSTTVIRFSCSEPGSSTFADLVGASVREV